jgi:predicted signal transduction protein with EAL and GGDEF domain
MGGDEFVVLQVGIKNPMEAALLARRIAAAISIPYVLDDARVEIATSIGIAVAPDDGIESEDLL